MPDLVAESPAGPGMDNSTGSPAAGTPAAATDAGNQVTVSLSGTDNATLATAGQEQTQTTVGETPELFGMDGSLLESSLLMGAYLFLILAVILLGFFLLRRFGPAGVARARGGVQPKLKGRLMLGNKQSVAVVKVLGRVMILGVTERSITLLDKMSVEECASTDEEEDEHAFTKFAEMLGKKRDEQNRG